MFTVPKFIQDKAVAEAMKIFTEGRVTNIIGNGSTGCFEVEHPTLGYVIITVNGNHVKVVANGEVVAEK